MRSLSAIVRFVSAWVPSERVFGQVAALRSGSAIWHHRRGHIGRELRISSVDLVTASNKPLTDPIGTPPAGARLLVEVGLSWQGRILGQEGLAECPVHSTVYSALNANPEVALRRCPSEGHRAINGRRSLLSR